MPEPGPGEMPGEQGKPPKPSPSPGPSAAPSATYSGAYAGVSPIDLTQSGILPGVLGPILDSLSTLHTCPGVSLIKLIHIVEPDWLDYNWSNPASGCPTTSNFAGILLSGALNSLIVAQVYQNPNGSFSPVVDKIAAITQGISEMFKKIEIRERITIGTPDQAMAVQVEQQVTHVAFTVFGTQSVAPLAANTLPAAYAKTPGSLAPRVAPPVADANLTFEPAPSMVIPVGQLAWDNLAPIIFVPIAGQTTLAATLTTLVDCHGMAVSLSSNATFGFISGAFEGFCTAALIGVAGAVEAAVKDIKLEGAQVDRVSGVLYDVSADRPQIDYVSDQIAEGTVTWRFAGENIPATLTAKRIYQ